MNAHDQSSSTNPPAKKILRHPQNRSRERPIEETDFYSKLPIVGFEEATATVVNLKKAIKLGSADMLEVKADIFDLLLPIVSPYDSSRAGLIIGELLNRDAEELLHYVANPRSIMVAVLNTMKILDEAERHKQNKANLSPLTGHGSAGGGRDNVEQTA